MTAEDALALLDRLTCDSASNRRLEHESLLTMKSTTDYAFRIIWQFADCMDIVYGPLKTAGATRMVYTQGANFKFDVGHVLYVSASNGNDHIQVRAAKPVTPGSKNSQRDPGQVTFDFLRGVWGSITRESGYTCTQDEFVRFLITGSLHDKRLT